MISHEKVISSLFALNNSTLATAESCTGGMLGGRITSISGSSAYYLGGVIAYSNQVKILELGVSPAVLRRYGAVSEQTARQMAIGVRERFKADFGISITGIAGPGGGSDVKPVGTVFIGLASGSECLVRRFRFKGSRQKVREAACDAALSMLAKTV